MYLPSANEEKKEPMVGSADFEVLYGYQQSQKLLQEQQNGIKQPLGVSVMTSVCNSLQSKIKQIQVPSLSSWIRGAGSTTSIGQTDEVINGASFASGIPYANSMRDLAENDPIKFAECTICNAQLRFKPQQNEQQSHHEQEGDLESRPIEVENIAE